MFPSSLGYGKTIVAITFVFPSLMTSFKKRLKKQPERSSQGETLIIILCLLLSGDVHQCPGPISNSGDSDKVTGRGDAVCAHPAGSNAASASEHFHLDLPSQSVHGDSCFECTGQDMCTAESALHEDKWCEGVTNEQPGLESDQLEYSSRGAEGERRGAAGSTRRRNATERINLRQKRSNLAHLKPQTRRPYPDLMKDLRLDTTKRSPEVSTSLSPVKASFPFLYLCTDKTLSGYFRFTWLRGSNK
ncbi:unnamed protein product [Leuciscus chuanchicus]